MVVIKSSYSEVQSPLSSSSLRLVLWLRALPCSLMWKQMLPCFVSPSSSLLPLYSLGHGHHGDRPVVLCTEADTVCCCETHHHHHPSLSITEFCVAVKNRLWILKNKGAVTLQWHTHTHHILKTNKQTNRWSFYFSKWLNLVISQMIVQLLLHVLSSESHTTLCCAIFIQQKSSLSLFLRSLIWEMCELIIDLGFSKNVQLFSVALQWKWQNLLIPNLPCRGTVWEQFAFLFFFLILCIFPLQPSIKISEPLL